MERQRCSWCDPERPQAAGKVLQLRLPVKVKWGLITNSQRQKGRVTDLEIWAPGILTGSLSSGGRSCRGRRRSEPGARASPP